MEEISKKDAVLAQDRVESNIPATKSKACVTQNRTTSIIGNDVKNCLLTDFSAIPRHLFVQQFVRQTWRTAGTRTFN